MKNILLIIALSTLCACSSSTEKFGQIKKDITRAEVIAIMGQPTTAETFRGIETLTYEYDHLDRTDLYLVLVDADTRKVLESAYTREPAPEAFIEKWKWYLARKIYKLR
jgi:outer membrane protein assembly factor BamE (lipoprotein component of BamABCDE complex)